MPLMRSTPPNMPPAPVMRMIEQIGPSDWSSTRMVSSNEPLRRPSTRIAASRLTSRATGVLPSSWRNSTQAWPSSRVPLATSVVSTVLNEMSTSGMSSRESTVPKAGGAAAGRSSPPLTSPNSRSGTGTSKRLPSTLETR